MQSQLGLSYSCTIAACALCTHFIYKHITFTWGLWAFAMHQRLGSISSANSISAAANGRTKLFDEMTINEGTRGCHLQLTETGNNEKRKSQNELVKHKTTMRWTVILKRIYFCIISCKGKKNVSTVSHCLHGEWATQWVSLNFYMINMRQNERDEWTKKKICYLVPICSYWMNLCGSIAGSGAFVP